MSVLVIVHPNSSQLASGCSVQLVVQITSRRRMADILKVRLASSEDSEDLLFWRNDPVTRAMSRNTDVVTRDVHAAWFKKALSNPHRLIYIGLVGLQKAGMTRFDRQAGKDVWEVSIMMAPEQRGKGMSKELLIISIHDFLASHPAADICAEVKIDNFASVRIFESAGFIREKIHNAEFFIYVRQSGGFAFPLG